MEYRTFGQTGIQLSTVALGGLLARYEGLCAASRRQRKRVEFICVQQSRGSTSLTWVTATKSTSRMN